MSENSQGKPFKTLKLTSMKAADPTGSVADPSAAGLAADAPAKPEPTLPPKAEPVISAKPDVVTPTASGADTGGTTTDAKPELSAKDAAKPVSFNLVNLKVGGAKKTPSKTEDQPLIPPVADTPPQAQADESGAGKTSSPTLSPSAAVSPPTGFKPFKFLVPTLTPDGQAESGEASASRPQEIKLSKVDSGLGSVESVPVSADADADEVSRPGAFALKQASAPVKAEAAEADVGAPVVKAPVAKPSAKPMVVILVAAIALILAGGGAMVFLFTGKPTEPVKPVEVEPVAAVEPVEPETSEPTSTPESTKPDNSVAPVAPAPRTRNPELVVWLASAKITTIATQRVTMNDRIYSLGSAVNPEGTLRWIGRDSQTKDLLFIDDNGVVYNRSTGGR